MADGFAYTGDVTELRLRIHANGWTPVPITSPDYQHPDVRSPGKQPFMKGWQKLSPATLTEGMIRNWPRSSPDQPGTGLICGHLAAADIDVPVPEIAPRIEALARTFLGDTPFIRIGRAPKVAFLYRVSEPAEKIQTPMMVLNGIDMKVEVLGTGQQIVGYGIHPVTRQPYSWPLTAPHTHPFAEVPLVTPEALRGFVAASEAMMLAAGATPKAKKPKSAGPTGGAPRRPFNIPDTGNWPDPTVEEVADALRAVPNDCDWDGWVSMGGAIWDAIADDGEELFLDWSAQSAKHDPETTKAKWRSFSASPMAITRAYLFHHARANGWRPERERQRDAQEQEEPNGEGGASADDGHPDVEEPPQPENEDRADPPPSGRRRRAQPPPGRDPADWPMPIDILADGEATGSPELRRDHLPEALAGFVFDTAERMGVDPTAVALAALTACASVVNEDWKVQPKVHDYTWQEEGRIWALTVGGPSILKSPVLKAATRPIDKLDAEARKRQADAMERHRAEIAALKADKVPPEGWPKPPRCERHLIESCTIEALSEVLRDDADAHFAVPSGKVLSRHDELSGLIASFDSYKAGGKGGGDRAAYLQLWNGGRYVSDRIGRGAFACSHWSACIIGGIQPEPIQKMARDAHDDGLLQRFLFCVPTGQGEGQDRVPDQTAIDRYEALFPYLLNLRPPIPFAGTDRDRVPVVVKLTAEAQQYRATIEGLARAQMAMPDTSTRLAASLGKWPGQFARLLLIFHCIEQADHHARGEQPPPPTVISGEVARRVANLMRDVLLPHLSRADALLFATRQTSHARWLAGHILASEDAAASGKVTARDLQRAYGPLKAPESRGELQAVMQSLELMGWVQADLPDNPTRPISTWHVNPRVHSVFAARGEAERDRRRRAQDAMADALRRSRGDAPA